MRCHAFSRPWRAPQTLSTSARLQWRPTTAPAPAAAVKLVLPLPFCRSSRGSEERLRHRSDQSLPADHRRLHPPGTERGAQGQGQGRGQGQIGHLSTIAIGHVSAAEGKARWRIECFPARFFHSRRSKVRRSKVKGQTVSWFQMSSVLEFMYSVVIGQGQRLQVIYDMYRRTHIQ